MNTKSSQKKDKQLRHKLAAKDAHLTRAGARRSKAQLSGSHGEWTNSDDVKGARARSQTMQEVKSVLKQAARDAGKAAVRTALRSAGTGIGATLAGPKGAAIGGSLGAQLSRIIGSGDYVASHDGMAVTNSLFSRQSGVHITSTFGKGGSIRVQHREFIKNVVADGTSFKNDSVFVQPGLYESFPYLAGVAANYNEYKIHGLCYEYVSTSSAYSSVVAMGSVVLAANYIAAERAYASKSAMENSMGAVSSKPSDNIVFGLECADSHKPYNRYFVRTGDTSTVPQTLEDYARFQIALCNLPASTYPSGTVVGELWVTYDIEFFVMDLPTLIPGLYSARRATVSTANPLGTVLDTVNYQGVCYNCSTNATTVFFTDVPIGTILMITFAWVGTASACSPPSQGVFNNCEIYPIYSNIGAWVSAPDGVSDTTSRMLVNTGVRINADNASLVMNADGTYPTSSFCWVTVQALGQGIDFSSNGP